MSATSTSGGRNGWVVRVCGGLLVLSAAVSARAGTLQLRSGPAVIDNRTPAEAGAALADLPRSGARHAVLQFDRPLDDADRARLVAAGVLLQAYLGEHAYSAVLSSNGVNAAAIGQVAALTGVAPIQPDWKIHPLLAGGAAPVHAVVGKNATGGDIFGAYILFHTDVSLQNEAPGILTQHGATVRDVLETVNGMVIELPAANVAALAAADEVLWIEPALPRMSENNAENRAMVQANEAQAAPYNLDGTGVTVLVYDGGTARAAHQDFGGRVFVRDTSGQANHATHVSGTVGGSGAASGGTNRGMAPAVIIQSYGLDTDGTGIFLYSNPGDIEDDYGQAIMSFGADVANNSIGTNTETNGFPCAIQGDYGVTDSVIDGVVRGSVSGGVPFRIVWANGNERQGSSCDIEGFGDYYSTAPPATAKNHITVGALNANDDSMTSFSSWGPTDDGRMKPDISAPGCQVGGDGGVTSTGSASNTAYSVLCGTSMASPTVTGCCALLLEDFRAQFPGEPDPRNSTLKILLAQTAVDRGNTGPDYQFGYGSIRVRDAVDFLRTGNFEEDEVSQGGVVEYTVNVAPGTPVLKAMLAWDDPPAVPLSAVALVNDLDLVAIDPNNVTWLPWTLNPTNPSAAAVQTAANHRDNIEQVLVNNPIAGAWTIRVTAFNVPQGPQPFSVCASPNLVGEPDVRIILPSGVPSTLTPGVSANVSVRVVPDGQTLVPNSAVLRVRYNGGAYLSIPLTPAGGDNYTATLPPPTCAATPEFYFSAEGTLTGVVTNPPTAPTSVYSATVGQTVVHTNETFESGANGWVGGVAGDTATSGVWVRVDPVGTTAQPEDDHTPAPGVMCWVTGQGAVGGAAGANDVDGGVTTLLSPAFDVSGVANPVIGYWRWYSNGAGGGANNDTFPIEVSNNNGTSWVNVETIGPSGAGTSGGWIYHEFNLTTLLPPTAQVRLRFRAQDTGTASLVEAGIDDFTITSFQCTAVLADCNTNGIVDSDDIASGRSLDANGNQVPDECESQCPMIDQHPANQAACVGGSATLSVVASGAPPLTYQWRRGTTNLSDGGNISGATTTSLTINPVALGDAATDYNCVVTNGCGSATSNNATLSVQAAPSANAGGPYATCGTNSVALSGTASNFASVSWSTNGTGTFTNGNTLNATYNPSAADVAAGSRTLTLTAVGNAPCGNAVANATLTLTAAPTAIAGGPYATCGTTSVALSGSAANFASVSWSTDGTGTFTNGNTLNATYNPSAADLAAGSRTLTLTAVGNPPCGNDASNATLAFTTAPMPNAGPDQTVCAGNVSLSGSSGGATGCQWSTGGDGTFADASQLTTTYTPGPNDLNAGTVTLTLTCQPSPPCVASGQDSLTVTIDSSVMIVTQPDDDAACAGGTASFTVAASGAAPLSYQWRRGTTPLADGPTGNGSTISGAETTTLTISGAALADAALNYNCVVSNACGNATSDDAALAVFASGSGDVNGDALLNGIDVSAFVTAILSAGPPSAGYCAADMNADGAVTPADVPLFAAALVGP